MFLAAFKSPLFFLIGAALATGNAPTARAAPHCETHPWREFQLCDGDILVGSMATIDSASIQFSTTSRSVFSHATVIYFEPGLHAWLALQTQSPEGASIRPLDELYTSRGLAELRVYRHKTLRPPMKELLTHWLGKESFTLRSPLKPYDYEFNPKEGSRVFCTEAISQIFTSPAWPSDQIPYNEQTWSMLDADSLLLKILYSRPQNLGNRIPIPEDMDKMPSFEIVANQKYPEGTQRRAALIESMTHFLFDPEFLSVRQQIEQFGISSASRLAVGELRKLRLQHWLQIPDQVPNEVNLGPALLYLGLEGAFLGQESADHQKQELAQLANRWSRYRFLLFPVKILSTMFGSPVLRQLGFLILIFLAVFFIKSKIESKTVIKNAASVVAPSQATAVAPSTAVPLAPATEVPLGQPANSYQTPAAAKAYKSMVEAFYQENDRAVSQQQQRVTEVSPGSVEVHLAPAQQSAIGNDLVELYRLQKSGQSTEAKFEEYRQKAIQNPIESRKQIEQALRALPAEDSESRTALQKLLGELPK